MLLEDGEVVVSATSLFQPVVFSSVTVVIYLYNDSRRYILWISLILLMLMIILYFFGFLTYSNWIGGLGMGILVIVIFSYLPKLIRYGHI